MRRAASHPHQANDRELYGAEAWRGYENIVASVEVGILGGRYNQCYISGVQNCATCRVRQARVCEAHWSDAFEDIAGTQQSVAAECTLGQND